MKSLVNFVFFGMFKICIFSSYFSYNIVSLGFSYYSFGYKFNYFSVSYFVLEDNFFLNGLVVNNFSVLFKDDEFFILDISYSNLPKFSKTVALELKLYSKTKSLNHYFENSYLENYQQYFKVLKDTAVINKIYMLDVFSEFYSNSNKIISISNTGFFLKKDNVFIISSSSIFLNEFYLGSSYSGNNMVFFNYVKDSLGVMFPNGSVNKEFLDKYDFIFYIFSSYFNMWALSYYVSTSCKFSMSLWSKWSCLSSHGESIVLLESCSSSEMIKSSYSCSYSSGKGYVNQYNIPFHEVNYDSCFLSGTVLDFNTYNMKSLNSFMAKSKLLKKSSQKDVLKNTSSMYGESLDLLNEDEVLDDVY